MPIGTEIRRAEAELLKHRRQQEEEAKNAAARARDNKLRRQRPDNKQLKPQTEDK